VPLADRNTSPRNEQRGDHPSGLRSPQPHDRQGAATGGREQRDTGG
jgi:hypothetical protein